MFPDLSLTWSSLPCPIWVYTNHTFYAPQVATIGPDHADHAPWSHSLFSGLWPEPWLGCVPMDQRIQAPSKVTLPSCDDCTTMCHPGHLISGPGAWGFQLSFLGNLFSILLHANAYLIALQQLCPYLLSPLTWRLIVCTPVSCSYPCLPHPMWKAAIVTDTLQPPSQ